MVYSAALNEIGFLVSTIIVIVYNKSLLSADTVIKNPLYITAVSDIFSLTQRTIVGNGNYGL